MQQDHLKFLEVVEEHRQQHVARREVESRTSIVYLGRHKGASKKQGDLSEREGDHGHKESDPALKSRDDEPKIDTSKRPCEINPRAPEQTETPLHTAVEHNASTGLSPMESFAPKSLFPGPQPGTSGWLDD